MGSSIARKSGPTSLRRLSSYIFDSTAVILGRYGQFAVTLVTLPLIARSLSADEFALYAVVTGAYFYGSIICDWGISLALGARLHLVDTAGGNQIRQQYFTLRLALLASMCALSAAAAAALGTIAISVGLLAGGISSMSEDWVLVSRGQFIRSLTAQWTGRAAYLGSTFVAIVYWPSAVAVALALTLGGLTTMTLTWFFCGFPGLSARGGYMKIFSLGLPSVTAKFLANSYGPGIATFIAGAVALPALAVYSASDRLIRAVQSAIDGMVIALFPRLSNRLTNRPSSASETALMFIAIAFVASAVAAGLWVSMPVLNHLLFGQSYETAVALGRTAIFLLPAAAITSMASTNVLLIRGLTIDVLLVSVVGAVATATSLAISWGSLGSWEILHAVLLGEWSAAVVALVVSFARVASLRPRRARESEEVTR